MATLFYSEINSSSLADDMPITGGSGSNKNNKQAIAISNNGIR